MLKRILLSNRVNSSCLEILRCRVFRQFSTVGKSLITDEQNILIHHDHADPTLYPSRITRAPAPQMVIVDESNQEDVINHLSKYAILGFDFDDQQNILELATVERVAVYHLAKKPLPAQVLNILKDVRVIKLHQGPQVTQPVQ